MRKGAGKDSDMAEKPQNTTASKPDRELPFYERYLLTVDEAAVYFHIGPKKMYSLIQSNQGAKWILLNGNRKMIKKALFARWLDQQAEI